MHQRCQPELLMVERRFREFTTKRIYRGSLPSAGHLEQAIIDFIAELNMRPSRLSGPISRTSRRNPASPRSTGFRNYFAGAVAFEIAGATVGDISIQPM